MTRCAKLLLTLAFIALISSSAWAVSEKFEIDQAHSNLGFTVKHLAVSNTRGSFEKYTGAITFDPEDFSTFKAEVSIQAPSINTKNESRDTHLRGPDFFEVDKYPTISFVSQRLEKRGEGAVIIGDLTIKDVTKTVTIPVEISGPVQSPMGAQVIGISGQTFINRKDFNVSWNKTLDSGGLVVDDIVSLNIDIEAQKK